MATYVKALNQPNSFLVQQGMPSDVAAIRREHIESFLVALSDAGNRPATVANRYRSLQQVVRWLAGEDEIRDSPMARMRPPAVPEEPPPTLVDLDGVVTFGTMMVAAPALRRAQDRNERMTRSVLAGGKEGLMRTSHAGAVVALALLLSACGSPGSATPSADEPSVAATESPSPTAPTCGDWAAAASDDVVLLYFPCGSLGEMVAVERAVTETGDERVAQVVQLYLSGPRAEEREAGFSTMLALGDIDIVEVSPPRLVLDFPSEVNNVSTSAGSQAVLDGLRQTLIGLNGIEEIELRLRNDCAALFEWIQVGPTCHVLTAGGLAPAHAPLPAAAAIQVATCEHSSGAYRVVLPEGWWTNPRFEDDALGQVAACRFFASSEFDVASTDRETPIPEGAAIWINYLENTCIGYISEILTSYETTIAGYPAVVSELAFAKEEAGPPHTYEYVVTLTPDTDCETGGRYIRAITSRDDAGDFEDNQAALDQMMETIEIRYP